MKFLCMICAEEMMEDMPPADAEAHFGEYLEFTKSIKSNGNYVSGNRLQPPDTARTVRVRDGKVLRTEGPYAETKEQIGGYFLIEATDMNEATEIAARIPGARYGCVELRPIADDRQTRALELYGLEQI
jgi:hypothetical protein